MALRRNVAQRERTGSCGTLEDLFKRKREEEDVFAKSKVLARSPQRTTSKSGSADEEKREGENFLEVIMMQLELMREEIKELKQAVNMEDIKKELREMREERRLFKEEVQKERETWRTEKEALQSTIRVMSSKITYMENQSRRDNLVLRGVEENAGESWEDCSRKVMEVGKMIGVDLKEEDIIRAHRTGGGPKPRPIVAKMRTWELKDQFMRRKKNLNGKSRILVQEDFARNTIEERRKLIDVAKQRKEKGEDAFVKFDKLFVNEGIFKWDLEKGEMYQISNRRQGRFVSQGNDRLKM